MSNLSHRQQKIQDRRQQKSFREFLLEIGTWMSLGFTKQNGFFTKYEIPERLPHMISIHEFNHSRDSLVDTYAVSDTTEGFFEAFRKLRTITPQAPVIDHGGNESSTFADCVMMSKNCYLSNVVINECEDILYSNIVIQNNKSIINANFVVDNCSNIFQSSYVVNSFNIFYSKLIINSSDIRFCVNCSGCHSCLMCHDLQNQSYCIENKQYTKETFDIQKQELVAQKSTFDKLYNNLDIGKCTISSEQSQGNFIAFSDQITDGYFIDRVSKGKNLMYVNGPGKVENMVDCFDAGVNSNNMYAVRGCGVDSQFCYCSVHLERCTSVYYSYNMVSCSFCLGCIGLRNKSYCILNKQYSKDEREQKANDIFGQMEKDGTLGSFFPASLCPYYFNDTAAYLIDNSFTKEEVTAKGHLRREEAIKVDIPADAEIVLSTTLDQFESFDSEGNRIISADILKKVIQDEKGNSYRIIPMEYKFLMKHSLPLPRKHRLERMKENFRID